MAGFTVSAQTDKSNRPSPPAQVNANVSGIKVIIDYSQPSLKSRGINTLAPVGKVWRTGANEASWIYFSDNVTINDKLLPKGKYGLFTINNKEKWTIIFNSEWQQWGHYDYEQSKDVLRVEVTSEKVSSSKETFTIEIEDGEAKLMWGTVIIPFTISK